MTKQSMKNLYSPSMLTSYLSCRHIIFNEINEKKLNLKKIELTKNDKLRIEKGNEHEKEYFNLLINEYSKVIDIKELDLSIEEKINATREALKEGYEVIHGGYLARDKWLGEFDFLVINRDIHSNFGDYGYEVIDTKNSKKPKSTHIIQLGMYTYMLEGIQGTLPSRFTIVLKDMKKEYIDVNQVYDFFNTHRKRYELFIEDDVDQSKPEKCSHCQICHWQEECKSIWIENDHLNQIGGLTKVHLKTLYQNDISKGDDLAKQDIDTRIRGIREEISSKLIRQAKLQKEYSKTNKVIYEINQDNLESIKGFNLLPKPSLHDLYFDIESIEDHVYPGGLEYLFGIYYRKDNQSQFKAFWAHDKEQEKKLVIDFFDFTQEHFKKYPDSKIYHYGSYEITALLKLTSLHQVKGIEYDNYLRTSKFVNLLNVNKQGLYLSENSYSLKNVEKFYNFKRDGDVQKGDVSQDYYSEWIETQDQYYLDEIEKYNEQDCRSTYELHQWLLSIKPENTSWYAEEQEDIKIVPKDFEIEMLKYQNKVHESSIEDKSLKQLITDIIGFYNREDKPAWREFFDRKILSDWELINDPECIGNMRLIKEPKIDKRSYSYTYKYEQQDFKLRKSKRCIIANNNNIELTNSAGKITDIDYSEKIVTIKRGMKPGLLPKILSIGPGTPIPTKKLNQNTYNFIDDMISTNQKYHALKDILHRKPPNIKNINRGDNLLSSDQFDVEIPKLLDNIKNSYLYIQGPPGTGKTQQATTAIVHLLSQNKKIAVTGLSHKVIHNLLGRVDEKAIENNCSFKGYKKGDLEDEDTIYKGTQIHTYDKDSTFIDALENNTCGQLFAGTKYHLANEYYEEKLDFLFIDEAGQLSLADLISIGHCAKNIILIGDQNQLGQPLRGTHPNESGNSILDYLLQGEEIIPNDKGILLDKTYRLHSKINKFISSKFYENRLICDESTDKRIITFNSNHLIRNAGIHYIEMNHKNNTQTSVEEIEIIKKIMNEMIGLQCFDGDKKRTLEVEDFLIISPFNTQVNKIESELSKSNIKSPRVGTIDRFQGQQALIGIISMTSSDSESLPRNQEFFFSKNRLNVAMSRAQVASIIMFNPNLLNNVPRNINYLKMMNNFFHLINYN